ncbi:MAG: hypothetical protein Tsb0014_46720 [Pleurocapsa sp.]
MSFSQSDFSQTSINDTDILMDKISNRYKAVLAVARRAKMEYYWQDEAEKPHIPLSSKPVPRTIKAMAEEFKKEDRDKNFNFFG